METSLGENCNFQRFLLTPLTATRRSRKPFAKHNIMQFRASFYQKLPRSILNVIFIFVYI